MSARRHARIAWTLTAVAGLSLLAAAAAARPVRVLRLDADGAVDVWEGGYGAQSAAEVPTVFVDPMAPAGGLRQDDGAHVLTDSDSASSSLDFD